MVRETGELTAELHDTHSGKNSLIAEIVVKEDGKWVGDFFAEFGRMRLSGRDQYVADWDSITTGNGIYVDEWPCFWPVQEVAKELNEKYELREFTALDTGKNDI